MLHASPDQSPYSTYTGHRLVIFYAVQSQSAILLLSLLYLTEFLRYLLISLHENLCLATI